jgi:hypothetical protein
MVPPMYEEMHERAGEKDEKWQGGGGVGAMPNG